MSATIANPILHIRIEIGDTKEEKVFSDEEIKYFLESSNYNFTETKIKIIDRLIADSYKFHKFTLGSVSADPSNVANNLLEWRKELVKDLEKIKSHSEIVK